MSKKELFPTVNPLFSEIRELIEQSLQQVAVTVNSAMSRLYWQVGKRINEEVLNLERADYGEQIVQTLSAQLTAEYGREIVATLWRQLSDKYGTSFSEKTYVE